MTHPHFFRIRKFTEPGQVTQPFGYGIVERKRAFLDQQQQPGDHRKINLRGDCASFEARPARPGFWQRLRGGAA